LLDFAIFLHATTVNSFTQSDAATHKAQDMAESGNPNGITVPGVANYEICLMRQFLGRLGQSNRCSALPWALALGAKFKYKLR
jgi:hypothetical protein